MASAVKWITIILAAAIGAVVLYRIAYPSVTLRYRPRHDCRGGLLLRQSRFLLNSLAVVRGASGGWASRPCRGNPGRSKQGFARVCNSARVQGCDNGGG